MAEEPSQVPTENRLQARSGHIAVCVEKFMFVWGGFNEIGENIWHPQERYMQTKDVWVYHADICRWYCKKTRGDVPPGTSGAAAVVVDHCLYLIGGHTDTGNTNHVYSLDLHTWQWELISAGTPHSKCPSPRDKFAAWEYKNKLYIFGGFGHPIRGFLDDHGDFFLDATTWQLSRGWNNQLLIMDLVTREWLNPAIGGAAPSPRAAHSTARLQNKVFLFGGRHNEQRLNDLHCLDLDELKWSGKLITDGEVPRGRSWHSLTAISETHALLYGGFTQNNEPLSDGWLLDTVALQWTQLEVSADRPRLWHTACYIGDGDVLVFGGCCNNILSDEEETKHTNKVIVICCSAKSLISLCLDLAFKHREVLEKEWHILPRHLYQILQLRKKGFEPTDVSTESHTAKTCTVS